MKIVTILGARPQFIKAAAFSRALKIYPNIEEVIVHTGQHYDQNMSDIFFQEMDIPKPKYQLNTGGKSHGAMTGQQLEKTEEILIIEKPDIVLVYGDTNSTLAGALAAVKLHIPVVHIEAGLRSFNRRMPEEINRILTDQISSYLFVPSEEARKNLLNEGVDKNKIFVVGDIMYDVSLYYKKKKVKPIWFDELNIDKFILCTIHRAENTDVPHKLKNIFEGLSTSKSPIVLPLHPRTLDKIKKVGISIPTNVFIVEPVGYLEMVWLEINSEFIITDSGGVQKEAYFHGKQCITLRDETEWVELVQSGVNILVGNDIRKIKSAINNVQFTCIDNNIYGQGNTAGQIANFLEVNI
ncbi:non-hydrolyzing UDP-N-acetylglucosamine 2-epimerase [Psychrobacter sp. KCTC 72983]|uniref:non-hydrolyzing UDP-N-acetylglucosamine 2-epimerase n=1 Tax=Psychrobacter sp. KCTC 72983 TaxID=2733866 RepID=UPI0016468DBD|nr:UDP-N-acetylglucosamine 2-epimerase (non-hydrolyzing) [Psychrobacter sp. KCTC 72983]